MSEHPSDHKVIVLSVQEHLICLKALRSLVSENKNRLKFLRTMGSAEFMLEDYEKTCQKTEDTLIKIEKA